MRKWILIYIIAFSIGIVPKIHSQSEAFFLGHASGVGGRALSMGSAYLAISDDYSATLWNPAGLTQLRRMEFFSSLSHLQFFNDASYLDISKQDKTSKTRMNSIGFAFPIPTYRGSLVFAVGYNRVRDFDGGFSFSWLKQPSSNREYRELEEGGLTNWVFAGGLEVTKNLSIGAAINLWRGSGSYDNVYNIKNDTLSLDGGITWSVYDEFEQTNQIKTKYNAINFKIGALYKFAGLARFAATIATPFTLDCKEQWSWSYQAVNPDAYDGDGDNWPYGIKSPFVFAAGTAITFIPNLVVSADVEYTDWSQSRYTDEPPEEGETKSKKNWAFKDDFQETITYRFGGEFTVPLINAQIRAGVTRQPSPLKQASSKADRNYITFGGGILLDKQVKLDFAWVRGWWRNEKFYEPEDYVPEVIKNTTEDISINKYFATMSIRF